MKAVNFLGVMGGAKVTEVSSSPGGLRGSSAKLTCIT
jgi:hypothetical protein